MWGWVLLLVVGLVVGVGFVWFGLWVWVGFGIVLGVLKSVFRGF
jgi:hypothetical protein